ncbi:MAG TPA: very short patch repair endonuclease [Thermoanaerobaculia bacterium]
MSRTVAKARVDPQTRYRMSRVPSRDTGPEVVVRRALHRSGYRFRLHRADLPGSPDIVLPRFRTAVFVHGCFWHGHHCKRGTLPRSNASYWESKIRRNQERDRTAQQALREQGWRTRVIWTCAIDSGVQDLLDFLHEEET